MTQKTKLVTLIAVIIGIVGIWYFFNRGPQPEYDFTSIAFKKTGEIVQVYVPKNEAASILGLGGRDVLPEDYGMFWHFSTPRKPVFTMHGMRIPLDFLWLKDGKIAEITSSVSTGVDTLSPSVDITGVLEVNSGYAAKRGLKAGDEALIMGESWPADTGN
ncbi:MAG: DUF192 domain-containing protein [bacterium]